MTAGYIIIIPVIIMDPALVAAGFAIADELAEDLCEGKAS